MNTTQMKCFLSLAKTLSFSDTAGSLYLSQQAVSKNIANLESELGVRLFERDHHRVSLSEEGKRYYGFFLRFAEEFEELKNDIDSSRSVKPVQLRCGYQIGLDMGPVPYDVQKTTQNNYPGFTHICERRSPLILQQMLLEKELDLVVIYKNFIKPYPGLILQDLVTFPLILMVSEDDPNAVPGAVYTDFSYCPFIFDSEDMNSRNSDTRSKAQDYARNAGLEPAQIMLVYNRESAFTAAEQGMGFILTSRFSHAIRNPLLKSYKTDTTETLTAVWRTDVDSKLIRDYVEELEKNLKDFAVQTAIK